MKALIVVMLLSSSLGASATPKALSYLWPPREATPCLEYPAHARPGLRPEDQALLNFGYFARSLGANLYANRDVVAAIDLWEIPETERATFTAEFERLAQSHGINPRLEFRWRPGGEGCAAVAVEAR